MPTISYTSLEWRVLPKSTQFSSVEYLPWIFASYCISHTHSKSYYKVNSCLFLRKHPTVIASPWWWIHNYLRACSNLILLTCITTAYVCTIGRSSSSSLLLKNKFFASQEQVLYTIQQLCKVLYSRFLLQVHIFDNYWQVFWNSTLKKLVLMSKWGICFFPFWPPLSMTFN